MTVGTDFDVKKKLFVLSPTFGSVPARIKLTNGREVINDDHTSFYLMDQKVRGFDRHRRSGVRPKYLLELKYDKKPNDVLIDDSFIVVADFVKALFQSIDATAFDFLPVEIQMESGASSNDYWLCDVTRVLDALDENHSDISIIPAVPKIYYLAGAGKLMFRTDAVGDHHIFRMKYAERTIICDESMYNACINANITGLCFTDTTTMIE